MALLSTATLCIGLAPMALGFGIDLESEDYALEQQEPEGRFLLPLFLSGTNLGGLNFNLTILAALLASLSSALMSLFTLTGLGLLMAANKNDKDHGGQGHGSSYSSYRKRMLSPLDVDWESISFLDWLSILRETWNSFDPSDIECQKRFVCDLHQSQEELGPMAGTLVHYFSYLDYASVMRIPAEIKSLLGEYTQAAQEGTVLSKDCGEIYHDCEFDVKSFVKKYSLNTVGMGEGNSYNGLSHGEDGDKGDYKGDYKGGEDGGGDKDDKGVNGMSLYALGGGKPFDKYKNNDKDKKKEAKSGFFYNNYNHI